MVHLVDELKNRARILHRQAQAGEPGVLAQLRALPELRGYDDAALATEVKRRHCLAAIAQQLGFAGWPQVTAVLCGDDPTDFGTLLYPKAPTSTGTSGAPRTPKPARSASRTEGICSPTGGTSSSPSGASSPTSGSTPTIPTGNKSAAIGHTRATRRRASGSSPS
ncbi:MAG: hypothetical protein HC897_13110 [Thermoanaerobaculia bacterium]|nr:hypothetical protein [Thermoanaerobaculia bacterium]